VPTVRPRLRDVVFWSIEIAGLEAVDVVDVRLLHHLEELPRVSGERLDVAPLALGVDRVDRQARLAEPESPVMQIRRFRGRRTVMS